MVGFHYSFVCTWIVVHCVSIPHFLYPSSDDGHLDWFQILFSCEQYCYKQVHAGFSLTHHGYASPSGVHNSVSGFLLRNLHIVSQISSTASFNFDLNITVLLKCIKVYLSVQHILNFKIFDEKIPFVSPVPSPDKPTFFMCCNVSLHFLGFPVISLHRGWVHTQFYLWDSFNPWETDWRPSPLFIFLYSSSQIWRKPLIM